MGKSENSKRALWFREYKRKQEELNLAGLSPAGKILVKRSVKKGGEIWINKGEIKYSELLEEYVKPIISPNDDIAIIKTKYIFGAHVWNATILREKSEEIYQLAKKDVIKICPNKAEFEKLFDEMAKRKQEEFSEYKNIIADFEIKKNRGLDYDLTVAAISSEDL